MTGPATREPTSAPPVGAVLPPRTGGYDDNARRPARVWVAPSTPTLAATLAAGVPMRPPAAPPAATPPPPPAPPAAAPAPPAAAPPPPAAHSPAAGTDRPVEVVFGERPPDTLARWHIAVYICLTAVACWALVTFLIVTVAVAGASATVGPGDGPNAGTWLVAGGATLTWAASTAGIAYVAITGYGRLEERWAQSMPTETT